MRKNLFFYKSLFVLSFIFCCAIVKAQQGFDKTGMKQVGMQPYEENFTSFSVPHESKFPLLWARLNNDRYRNHPEYGKESSNPKYAECVEVLEKRKANERYFINAKNPAEFLIQKSIGALHYLKNGDWLTIKHKLEDKGNGIAEASEQWDPVGFNTKYKHAYIKTPYGQVDFNRWSLYGLSGEKEELLAHANWSDYTVGEDGIYVKNIFPDIDAKMQVFRGAVKTNFIVKKLNYNSYEFLEFKDEFGSLPNAGFEFTNNMSGENHAASGLKLMQNAKTVLEIEEAYCYPEQGDHHSDRIVAEYLVRGNSMGILVPVSWINKFIATTHVIIDPLVSSSNTLAQGSITGSMYNASCSFTNSCNFSLTVNTPANATLTDVQWIFDYIAQGACTKKDGGLRFTTGACLSPGGAGLYWSCQNPPYLPGVCTSGSGISIWSDFSSCMPAPSCTPVPVTFGLQFFRDCTGSTGCSNSCIGANTAWTMTIYGQTLSYTGANPNEISVSASTICFGQTITASAPGQNGVPPYTWSWSFSNTGSPVIATGASVTISFPAVGTYTLYCTITDACGNSIVSTKVITVNGPTITTTQNTYTVCSSNSASLNVSGATTYTWTPSTGLNNANSATPVATPASTTVYTVTGTSSGCTSAPITVTVNVTPNPTITITGTSPICNGQSTVLTGSGATNYTWSANAGGVNTSTVSVSPSTTTTYTLTGATAGCTSTKTITITVTPNPTVTVNSPTICKGSSTTLTASGATTYSWSPGTGLSSTSGTSVTANPTVTTTYTVIGTTGSCTNSATAVVTVNPTPTVTVNSPTICKGSSTTLTANGATTYSWSPGTGLSSTSGTSVTANPTVTTTYTVVGTTGTCTSSATSIVTVNPTPTVTVNSPTICIGNSTTLTASGATTYSWSPGTGLSSTSGTSVTANPTVTTTYTIVGTTGTCTSSITSTVTVNPSPTVTVNSATICPGASTTLTASGASTYTWSPATGLSGTTGASVTANPTVTTTYTVTGTSAATCTATATAIVTVNPLPTITVNSATMCPGSTSTLTASGANTYTWSPATGLSSNTGSSVTCSATVTTTYTVTGTSVAGCTATATSTVTIGGAITPTVNSATICSGSSATLTASGGATYTWSPGTGLSSTSGSTVTANPTVTTTYTVTAASGACTGTATSVVTVNPLPTVTVNSPTICIGNSATLNASGATTYSWTPGNGLSSTSGASVTANPTVTTTYTVVGTSSSCTSTATSIVTVNPLPTITVNNGTICTGGSATLTASGANTYTWSPATGLSSTTGASVTASPTVTTNYTVSGTSAAGCINTATTSVTVVTNPTVTVSPATICIGSSTTLNASGASTYSWTPATGLSSTTGSSVTANPTVTTTYTITGTAGTCNAVATTTVTVNPLPVVGVNTATICVGQQTATLTANGASTYSWSPGTGLSSTAGSSVTANPTSTTNYTVTGTDINGCVNTATTSVTVNPLPTITVNNGTICTGGSATLTATGASTYTWSPATGLSSTTGASVTASPTITTNYTVTGTSAAGCINTATTSVTVVTNPTVTVSPATICIGSSTTLNASGASTYSWSPGTGLSSTTGSSVTANPTVTTSYTITGTAGTCNAVTTTTVTVNPLPVVGVSSATICIGQQTATLTATGASTYSWSPATGLSSTTGSSVTANPTSTTNYTVTGTDVNGCVNTATTSVTVNPLPTITVNPATICGGSSATLNAAGASTYSWSPGTGLSSTTGSSVTANPTSSTNYTVAGIDINGCANFDTVTVTVVTNPTVTVTSATICAGSSTTLNASGASAYSWSPAAGLSSTTGASVTANPTVTTNYTITGTSGTCTDVATATVTVNPLPVITIGSNSPVCVNQNLNLTSSGGPGYAWSGPNSFSSTAQNPTINGVSSAAAGTYSLVITDANSCVSSATVSVVVNPLPVVVATGATVCIGSTINLTATGGTNYSWSGPLNYNSNQQNPGIPNATVNMSGSYVVTVTDINGCVNANVAQVTVNPALTIVATNNGPICQNATLNLFSNSGVSWTWSGPGGFGSFSQNPSIPNAQVAVSGIYTVTGTDANGCTGTDTTNVLVNPLPNVTVNSDTICATQQTAILIASGAATYSWSPATGLSSTNGNPVTASPLLSTTYIVTGTDQNGCINFANASVTVNQLPTITASSAVICQGSSAPINANGATTYTWTPSSSLSSANGGTVTANPASTTNYTVTGTDLNGCTGSATSTVSVNPLPIVTVNSGTICPGKSMILTANGANTYNWSPSTGLNANSGVSVTASPGTTTSYSVAGTDLNGCIDTAVAVVTLTVLPPLVVAPVTTSGCVPVCVNLSVTTTVTGTYNWSLGDGNTSALPALQHCYTVAGTYYAVLSLTDGNGCVNKDTSMIVAYPVPTADFSFGPQPTTILDPQINFVAYSHGANITQWNWSFGDAYNNSSVLQNPSFSYQDPGTFAVQLVVTSNYGCKDSTTRTVIIGEDFMIYVPNAFTPNFDGSNDIFMAKGEGVKDFVLYVFDRWGNQVFYSDDIHKGWDGRFQAKGTDIMQEDIYVWKIELKTFKGEPRTLKGTVSLLK